MRHINKFYSTLYENQHLGLIPIDVINDTSKCWHAKIYLSLEKLTFLPFCKRLPFLNMNKQGSKTNSIYLNLNEISFQNLQVNNKMDFIIWNVLYV